MQRPSSGQTWLFGVIPLRRARLGAAVHEGATTVGLAPPTENCARIRSRVRPMCYLDYLPSTDVRANSLRNLVAGARNQRFLRLAESRIPRLAA